MSQLSRINKKLNEAKKLIGANKGHAAAPEPETQLDTSTPSSTTSEAILTQTGEAATGHDVGQELSNALRNSTGGGNIYYGKAAKMTPDKVAKKQDPLTQKEKDQVKKTADKYHSGKPSRSLYEVAGVADPNFDNVEADKLLEARGQFKLDVFKSLEASKNKIAELQKQIDAADENDREGLINAADQAEMEFNEKYEAAEILLDDRKHDYYRDEYHDFLHNRQPQAKQEEQTEIEIKPEAQQGEVGEPDGELGEQVEGETALENQSDEQPGAAQIGEADSEDTNHPNTAASAPEPQPGATLEEEDQIEGAANEIEGQIDAEPGTNQISEADFEDTSHASTAASAPEPQPGAAVKNKADLENSMDTARPPWTNVDFAARMANTQNTSAATAEGAIESNIRGPGA
ncbi:MAG: hypothetical protein K0U12_07890 [Gammaproteobacteria bacterium]|nr:hypothetical protein [Gammaproteobacteria bacterium]